MENTNKKRYWLGGGIIISLINTIIFILGIIFLHDSSVPNGDLGLLFLPNVLISVIFTDRLPDIFGYWSNFYYGILFWFGIGTVIGWIYGKVKNRKSLTSNS